MADFIAELKRRRVCRAVALYVVSALGVLQAADLILPSYDAPPGTMRVLITIALIGLPIAAVLGWLFDVRPREGVQPGETRRPRIVLAAALLAPRARPAFKTRADADIARMWQNVVRSGG